MSPVSVRPVLLALVGLAFAVLAVALGQGAPLQAVAWGTLAAALAGLLVLAAGTLRCLRPALFSTLTLVAVAGAVAATEQGHDLARLLATQGPPPLLSVALAVWQLGSWWEGREGWRRTGSAPAAFTLWYPRLLAWLAGALGLATYLFGARLADEAAAFAAGLLALSAHLVIGTVAGAAAVRRDDPGVSPRTVRILLACGLCLGIPLAVAGAVQGVAAAGAPTGRPLAAALRDLLWPTVTATGVWLWVLGRRPLAHALTAAGVHSTGLAAAWTARTATVAGLTPRLVLTVGAPALRTVGAILTGSGRFHHEAERRLGWLAPAPLAAALLLAVCAPAAAADVFGSFGVVLLTAGGVLGLLGWLQHRGLVAPALLLAAAGFLTAGLFFPYHPLRLCPDDPACAGAGMPPPARPDPAALRARWATTDTGDGPRPLVLVATAGGGIRAALFTLEVLRRLDRETGGRFTCALLAVSAVSGGAVGAGLWLLEDGPGPCRGEGRGFDAEALARTDLLADPLLGLLLRDLPRAVVPVATTAGDRAALFERRLEALSGGRLVRPFTALFPWLAGPGGPWRPALLVNATHQETGARVVVAPVRLPEDGDLVDFLAATGRDLPAATALHLSARFAWISPAARWQAADGFRGHLLDGGYAENSGAATLGDLLAQVLPTPSVGPRPLVIQITSDPAVPAGSLLRVDDRTGACGAAPPPARPGRWLTELRAPLAGVLVSREARTREAMRELCAATRARAGVFLHFGLCREVGAVPLGWTLSGASRRRLAAALDRCGNPRELERFREAFAALATAARRAP